MDAARLLFQLAEDTAKDGTQFLRTKKLYVLGALQMEAYHELQRGSGGDTRAALDGLLSEGTSPEVKVLCILLLMCNCVFVTAA